MVQIRFNLLQWNGSQLVCTAMASTGRWLASLPLETGCARRNARKEKPVRLFRKPPSRDVDLLSAVAIPRITMVTPLGRDRSEACSLHPLRPSAFDELNIFRWPAVFAFLPARSWVDDPGGSQRQLAVSHKRATRLFSFDSESPVKCYYNYMTSFFISTNAQNE